MNTRELTALVLLGAIWGASFMFIRVAAPAFGPLLLMDLRVLLAGFVLLVFAFFRKQLPQITYRWREFAILGLFNAALPFTLIAFSQLTLTASLAAILNSTTPLFTATIAALWLGHSLTMRKIGGIAMGIIGVSILVGGSPLVIDGGKIIAVFASLGAALCYGIGTVYASKRFQGMKPLHTAIGQLFSAGTWLLIPAFTSVPSEPPSPNAIAALIALALISTSFAYQLYFFLINHVGPTKTATVTFLVPVFGTIWGVTFLQEPLSIGMILGMVVILASVRLVISDRARAKSPIKPAIVASTDEV